MQTSLFSLPTIADGEDKSCPFKNRIRKNYQHVRKWAKRTLTNAFRIYDRDIKEYPLAIDFYDGRFCVHFFTSTRDSDEPSLELEDLVYATLHALFKASRESIYWRTRVKRDKTEQYEKTDASNEFFTVLEYGIQFQVNLLDYLDTGLFLDHRETRRRVALAAKDKRLLNLFSYTCAFSVHAALSGALFTKSVDMSNTYNDWGRRNFELNGIKAKEHPIVRADCLKFLDEAICARGLYDLIVIDPPTVSRSKKMDQMFDIQLDYATLIHKALKLLAKEGTIFFSTNSRKFRFDASLFPSCSIEDISLKTLPIDFHDQKIHRCWKISKNEFIQNIQ
jgi:23S rRNA G2069 N7-methylase RlmK/C1962 C5-methylase RlmI